MFHNFNIIPRGTNNITDDVCITIGCFVFLCLNVLCLFWTMWSNNLILPHVWLHLMNIQQCYSFRKLAFGRFYVGQIDPISTKVATPVHFCDNYPFFLKTVGLPINKMDAILLTVIVK